MRTLSQLCFRAEHVHKAALESYEWFSKHETQPPRAMQFELQPAADLDRDISSVGREILGVENIPETLWAPFWAHHAFFGRKNYKSDSECWLEAVKKSEHTLSFLDYLAQQSAISFLSRKPSESVLKAAEETMSPPENLLQGALRIVWALPRRWALLLVAAALIVIGFFAVWNSFPDKTKEEVINRIIK